MATQNDLAVLATRIQMLESKIDYLVDLIQKKIEQEETAENGRTN